MTVVDNYSRECLAIEVGQHIRGEDVTRTMDWLKTVRGVPNSVKVDNGPEFISKELDKWAYENGVTLDYSRPGKPIDNAFIESFNGSFRDECLNVNWFLSLEDARDKIDNELYRCLLWCADQGPAVLRPLRKLRAKWILAAVRKFGAPAADPAHKRVIITTP